MKGTVRRPSKRPGRKRRVLVGGVWELLDCLLECSNAVSGGEGEPPVSGRGMQWRSPGWVDGEAMAEVEEGELLFGFIVFQYPQAR